MLPLDDLYVEAVNLQINLYKMLYVWVCSKENMMSVHLIIWLTPEIDFLSTHLHRHEAPAKAFAAQGKALREEISNSAVLHGSTQSVLKGHLKNSSRQYKRAVNRFNLAMTLVPETSAFFVFIYLHCEN